MRRAIRASGLPLAKDIEGLPIACLQPSNGAATEHSTKAQSPELIRNLAALVQPNRSRCDSVAAASVGCDVGFKGDTFPGATFRSGSPLHGTFPVTR